MNRQATTNPLGRRILARDEADPDRILERFLDYVAETGRALYPAQEEALLEIIAGTNVVLNTPTGSGKSLVAIAMHFKALCEGRRSFYTSPIKALASEKFFDLCQLFGAESVGMLTGDASINRDAPIICCTAEILANMALREGDMAPVDYAVIDEFHYYADRDRGVAWEVPILALPQTTFLLMSATLGETKPFEEQLTRLNDKPTVLVRSEQRPVPLDFEYRETPLHETLEDLVAKGKSPVYLVCFTQRSCAEEAQNLMSTNFCSREEKQAINDALADVKFSSPYGKEIQKFLRHGVGLHHAGLLPKYRLAVEKLAQRGLLKVICGTDTLGVGVNVPIRTVLFSKLCKYDGVKTTLLSGRDFKQISGRAGRKGFDEEGSVVAQAPEHVIENLRLEAKAGNDPAKLRKIVRRKPPEKGYVPWDREVFERLVKKAPEELKSQFNVSHGMLLNLLQDSAGHRRGGYGRMIELIDASRLDLNAKRAQRVRGRQLFKSLREGGVIEVVPRPSGKSSTVKLASGFQPDFSMHHTLGLYLLDSLDRLDPDAPDHAVNVLTYVESILENPDVILMKQLDEIKRAKLDELKAQGVEYEERIAELEKLEYPKPLRDEIYDTFNAFAKLHPWIGAENIRPKSVVRDMWERFSTFDEYIRDLGLQRSEGVLLRYLSDTYKALVQTVPDRYKTADILDIIAYLRSIVTRVDSSLIEEWEEMQFGPRADEDEARDDRGADRIDLRRDPRAIRARIRSDLQRFVKFLAIRDYEEAAACLVPTDERTWSAADLESAMAPFYEQHKQLMWDADARSARFTRIEPEGEFLWEVEQTLVDEAGDNDWSIAADARPDVFSAAEPVLRLRKLGP